MPKPEDVKTLPNGDLRANRVYLADHMFAVRKRGRKCKRDLVPQFATRVRSGSRVVHLRERHRNDQFRAHMDRFISQW